ncbi:MAG: RNA polymerase sigma-70 factor [Bacteroidota bacterium]
MKETKDIKTLLDQLSRNSAPAFREIFHIHSDQVYAFALRLTKSHSIAEEMVQEVFMKIWINRTSASTIENFNAYLFVITRNLVFNALKRQALEEKAKIVLSQELEKKHHDTEETVIRRDYERLLQETVNHLPPQQRLVYSLCHQEGLRYDEVAQRLKISRLTVKTHMQQALKTIKAQFANLGTGNQSG